jgi:glycosyltransferase involved in cell wall biosynthesis
VKKKILFVINTLGRGGAENALIQLINNIDKDIYDISLYVILGQGELIEKIPKHVHILNKKFDHASVLSKEGKKNLRKNIIGIAFSRFSFFKNFFYLLTNFFRMMFSGKIFVDTLLWKMLSDGSAILSEEYDLATAFLEGASTYYVRDHVRAKKKAAFIHVNYLEAGYNRKLDKNVYIDMDKIFAVSEDVRKSFLSEYSECKDKTYIFENILDVKSIIKKSEESGGFDDAFDGKRILTIARLTAQKAIDVSIDACRILLDKGENVKWYVLGDGDLRTKLEEKIKKEGLTDRFILFGVKDNPYPYLKQCDLYVHATKFEGKSIAIREAQVLGKPIIVSDCPSNLELVVSGGDALVTKLDAKAISDTIIKLLHDENLCTELGEKARIKDNDGQDSLDELLNLVR